MVKERKAMFIKYIIIKPCKRKIPSKYVSILYNKREKRQLGEACVCVCVNSIISRGRGDEHMSLALRIYYIYTHALCED